MDAIKSYITQIEAIAMQLAASNDQSAGKKKSIRINCNGIRCQ